MMQVKRIYVGAQLTYQQALAAYRAKVDEPFEENSFAYCWFTGMAEAELCSEVA